MKFYVNQTVECLDSFCKPDSKNGKYHQWVCVINAESEDDRDIYICHTEYYDNEDGWRCLPNSTWVSKDEINLDEYGEVDSKFCSNYKSIFYLPNTDLKPKRKPKRAMKIGNDCKIFTSVEAEKALKENQDALRKNFEAFKKQVNLDDYKLDDLLFLFYNQGHLDTTPVGYEISKEDWEKECFLHFVESCIENPENENKLNSSDYVRVTYPCTGHDKCIAWPDRLDEVGCDGETCSMIVNISKLCGIEDSADKLLQDSYDPERLTKEEIDTLANILERYRNN